MSKRKSIDELAMEYALPDPNKDVYDYYLIYEEMCNRLDVGRVDRAIENARKTTDLLGLPRHDSRKKH